MEIKQSELLLDANLELYLPMDYVADYSPDKVNCARVGTVNFISGKFGYGLCASGAFSSSNSIVSHIVALGAGSFSFGCWFKKNGVPTWNYTPTIVQVGTENPRAYIIAAKDTGYAGFYTYDGSYLSIDSVVNVCDNLWHQIVAVRDGVDLRLYVDTVMVSSGSGSAKNLSDGTVYISNASAGNDYMADALMDELFVFSRALSVTEINTLSSPNPIDKLDQYRRVRTPGKITGVNIFNG